VHHMAFGLHDQRAHAEWSDAVVDKPVRSLVDAAAGRGRVDNRLASRAPDHRTERRLVAGRMEN
jgi:hypothetical protein